MLFAVALLTPIKLLMALSAANTILDPIASKRRLSKLIRKSGEQNVSERNFGQLAFTDEEQVKLHQMGAFEILQAAKKRAEDLKVVGAM